MGRTIKDRPDFKKSKEKWKGGKGGKGEKWWGEKRKRSSPQEEEEAFEAEDYSFTLGRKW